MNGTIFAARSDNDTGNNPHNPMYGIYKAGADGQLVTLIGTQASDSGGNSQAPMAMIDPTVRPTKVDRPQDATGLVDTGKRYVIAAAAYNLSRILRALFGIGKPRTLQGPRGLAALAQLLARLALALWIAVQSLWHAATRPRRPFARLWLTTRHAG